MTESKVCPVCNKEFSRKPEDMNSSWKHKIYCSAECRIRQFHPTIKGRVLKICENCGKEYLARNFVTRTGCYQKFCCYECQQEFHRKKREREREKDGLC
jgi:hypothetical protein